MTKCFADKEENKCAILDFKDCYKCPFYKSVEQYDRELKTYPMFEMPKKGNVSVECKLTNKETLEVEFFESMSQLSKRIGKYPNWLSNKTKHHNYSEIEEEEYLIELLREEY